ncbi:hypothetical protein DBV15_01106 [Temnothorax longispinosus]|uniref:Uncharacterized protein n=1 Tax=Temnothorax longispinosus TaxID=300112 RepID=A0A4S2JA92_9HYME|nr:hypothetical protein DBV15_01106 [Temnothorax longispinosus]
MFPLSESQTDSEGYAWSNGNKGETLIRKTYRNQTTQQYRSLDNEVVDTDDDNTRSIVYTVYQDNYHGAGDAINRFVSPVRSIKMVKLDFCRPPAAFRQHYQARRPACDLRLFTKETVAPRKYKCNDDVTETSNKRNGHEDNSQRLETGRHRTRSHETVSRNVCSSSLDADFEVSGPTLPACH